MPLPMRLKFEQLFNHWTILALNIIIIVAIQLNHMFFIRTGLIHLIAIIFVSLGLLRLIFRPQINDQFLKPLIHQGIISLIVLATSHIIEYASYRYLGLPRQTIYANTINFYLSGLLLTILGIEVFNHAYQQAFNQTKISVSKLIVPISWIMIFLFAALTVLFLLRPQLVQLNSNSYQMYAYLFAGTAIPLLGIWRLNFLKKHASLMTNFVNYFTAAFILVGICILASATEEVVIGIGVSSMQTAIIIHFLFYLALSVMFLAYQQLLHPGGSYEDLNEPQKS